VDKLAFAAICRIIVILAVPFFIFEEDALAGFRPFEDFEKLLGR